MKFKFEDTGAFQTGYSYNIKNTSAKRYRYWHRRDSLSKSIGTTGVYDLLASTIINDTVAFLCGWSQTSDAVTHTENSRCCTSLFVTLTSIRCSTSANVSVKWQNMMMMVVARQFWNEQTSGCTGSTVWWQSVKDLRTPWPISFPVLSVKLPVLLAGVRIDAERKPSALQPTHTWLVWFYYYYYYYWTSIIKVSLSRKTSITLYISQHYKKNCAAQIQYRRVR